MREHRVPERESAAGGVTVAAAQPVVLLVEDEELVRVMTQRYLGARGFTVLAAST